MQANGFLAGGVIIFYGVLLCWKALQISQLHSEITDILAAAPPPPLPTTEQRYSRSRQSRLGPC